MTDETVIILPERIERTILQVRGQKVIFDTDLAILYEVETKGLLRAVKLNILRFPPDFMFQLTQDEFAILRYPIAAHIGRGGRRYLPYAFTEQGVAMLSSVLKSPRAVQVNVEIMRAFVRMRQLAASDAQLWKKIRELEQEFRGDFKLVFEALAKLMTPLPEEPEEPKHKRIRFDTEWEKDSAGKQLKGKARGVDAKPPARYSVRP